MRRQGWIGIDFGTQSVKIAQVERLGKRVRLRECVVLPCCHNHPTPPAEANGIPLASHEEIRAALSLGVGFHGRKAACTLPMNICEVQSFTLPVGSTSERRMMVANQLASTVSTGSDQHEFDHWDTFVPHANDDPIQDNVATLSVPQERAFQTVRDVARAGLRCEILDGLPLAMARAVRETDRDGYDVPTAALDWGYTTATFCVVIRGCPVYTRRLPRCGYSRMIDAVQRALDVSCDQAQHFLHTHGLAQKGESHPELSQMQGLITDATHAVFAELTDQLKKTFSYLKSQRPSLIPKKIWLFGGGATINNVTSVLERQLEMSVEPWRLSRDQFVDRQKREPPLPLLATAMALSALAWETT